MRMKMMDHIEKPGWLQSCNPVVKLGCALFSVLLATILWDPFSLAAGALTAVLLVWIGARIPPYRLLPVLGMFAITVWSLVLANNVFGNAEAQLDARWNPGLILGLRIANFAFWGIVFSFTTNPRDLALSLTQNLGISPAVSSGLMTAHRLLPLIGDDMMWIRRSLKLRRLNTREHRIVRSRFHSWLATARGVLLGALRRAERGAQAMEVRGFSLDSKRSTSTAVYYRSIPVRRRDIALIAFTALLWIAILLTAHYAGTLRFWGADW
ncbi:energy-coupling factor transporter transmembrane component T family protein [Spirochaeta dissipatitropha]